MATYRIQTGDCRGELKTLADCSVDSIVTDPPYELGFMGKGWDRSGIAYDVNVWIECLRVLKPGGHLLAFGGSRTYHRLACAIEDAGFEIRDQIQWLYGSGFPKSLDVSKAIDAAAGVERAGAGQGPFAGRRPNGIGGSVAHGLYSTEPGHALTAPATDAAKRWNGWGTALKPAHEPIVLARKPLIGTVAENVLMHGTGGLNIDRCRIEAGDNPRTWDNNGGGIFSPCDGKQDGLGMSQLGRWPANVIHDGSDEVLAGFPSESGAHSVGKARGDYEYATRGQVPNDTPFDYSDSGSAARFFKTCAWSDEDINEELCLSSLRGKTTARVARTFADEMADSTSALGPRFKYCPKASKEDREEGLESLPTCSAGDVTDRQDGSAGLNSPRAGAGRTNGSRNHHPTVKPTDLMRYLCRLVTPPNGIVLDPFCGSGSTGKAAILEGLNFIGIELSAEYCELAEKRIAVATRQGQLLFEATA